MAQVGIYPPFIRGHTSESVHSPIQSAKRTSSIFVHPRQKTTLLPVATSPSGLLVQQAIGLLQRVLLGGHPPVVVGASTAATFLWDEVLLKTDPGRRISRQVPKNWP